MQRACRKANHFPLTVSIIAISAIFLFFTQAAPAATVSIDLNTTHQTIRGFGGMNFPRWGHGLQNNTQVDTAFGNGDGQMGFTIMRIDVPPYTYAWGGAVDAAKRAIDNHGAIVIASPWSPPAWMKRYADPNDPLVGGELDPNFYGAYADHLSDFVDYMSDDGVSLYAISLQNEPDVSVDYESCDWTSAQMINFLANNASVIPTRVIAAESYHFDHSFTDPILNDPCAEAQVDIIGGHIYGGGLADYPLARSKGKEVWMTEHLNTTYNWTASLGTGKEIHDCMVANFNAYLWWYIRRDYGPMDEDGTITKRGYVMSHFAKFARPGYVRVGATDNPTSGVYVTAYKSGDTVVIVAINQNSSSREVTFSLSGGGVSSYKKYETTSSNNLSDIGFVGSTDTLAANSINTFVGTTGVADTTPPEPNPAIFADAPTAISNTKIAMTATSGSDASGPIEYYFTCTAGGGNNSGWQTSTTYTDSGLSPDTQYTYTVKMRDSALTPNVGTASAPESVTTFASAGEYQESGGVLSMEAENGTLGSRWLTGADAGASNDAYIEIDPAYNNTGSAPECTTAECIVTYDFNISTSGNYRFWFRMCSDNANDDSFFWCIDSGNWIQENNRSGIGSWFSRDNTQVDNLSTGSHVLEIGYRENGTRLDKFVVQLDSLMAPSGDGPAESSQNFGDQLTNCQKVQSMGYRLDADLNGDCKIEMVDLKLLCDQWLSTSPEAVAPNYSPDLVADNKINLADFAAMANQWLICNDPETAGCINNW